MKTFSTIQGDVVKELRSKLEYLSSSNIPHKKECLERINDTFWYIGDATGAYIAKEIEYLVAGLNNLSRYSGAKYLTDFRGTLANDARGYRMVANHAKTLGLTEGDMKVFEAAAMAGKAVVTDDIRDEFVKIVNQKLGTNIPLMREVREAPYEDREVLYLRNGGSASAIYNPAYPVKFEKQLHGNMEELTSSEEVGRAR